jgi:hypothetical protein
MAKPIEKEPVLTKRQASVINRGNRNISGNINALMDDLNNMTYGIRRTDKVDNLVDEFNGLLKTEIDSISKSAEGDTTSFLTKLFSENNKKVAGGMKELEDLFNVDEGQLEAFLQENYRNRLIKHSDLHEVASQLVELREAIGITRDAVISADVVDGHMSRNITIDDDSMQEAQEDYIPIIEKMEKKFKLQEKIKNFIVPKTLEFGEYYAYIIPYAKIFDDFLKEKNVSNGKYSDMLQYRPYSENYKAYSEATEITLAEFISKDETKKKAFVKEFTESVKENPDYISLSIDKKHSYDKVVSKEIEAILENITICNTPVPLCVLEEGVDSSREYFHEFVEKAYVETNDSEISFDHVMKGIDTGIYKGSSKNTNGKSKKSEFSNIKDCYFKLIDPIHLLPIEIMNETIGYYYIQEEDITPLSGIVTSTVYYNKYDGDHSESNVLSSIAETIVAAFDKKFLENNMKFKNLIVEALNYFKLNNRKIKFQFIPKEYIVSFKVNEDENGHGTSIIEPSLFYAKLYLMLLLFKIMSIVLNSNDTKVNYIKQSGIDKNVLNKIEEIVRKRQQRQVTLMDMFSYTTLINKIGQGSEMYIPVGKSGERGIETEILSGQDIQMNNELMEMLKKAYITGTGVPDVLMNYINEADFAKTLELANNRFQGRVVSYQLDFNTPITEMYKIILKNCTTIPEAVIESMEFTFAQPKYQNSNITNDLLNNHNALVEFLCLLFFGQDGLDDPKQASAIKRFKKSLAKDRLPMLNFTEIEDMFKKAMIEGEEDELNPENTNDEES